MKVFIFVFVLSLFVNYSKIELVNKDVDTYAYNAGRKIKGCCSTCAKNFKVDVHNYEQVGGYYQISMTVSWFGCFTGDYYYISGNLTVKKDGCDPYWRKTTENGVFTPNCGKNCYLGCLDN